MKIIRKAIALVSMLLFMAFIFLAFTRTEFLAKILGGYLRWLKDAPILIVLVLFLILSAISSRIIVVGIGRGINNGDNKALATRMFWWSFAFLFCAQIAGWALNR